MRKAVTESNSRVKSEYNLSVKRNEMLQGIVIVAKELQECIKEEKLPKM